MQKIKIFPVATINFTQSNSQYLKKKNVIFQSAATKIVNRPQIIDINMVRTNKEKNKTVYIQQNLV